MSSNWNSIYALSCLNVLSVEGRIGPRTSQVKFSMTRSFNKSCQAIDQWSRSVVKHNAGHRQASLHDDIRFDLLYRNCISATATIDLRRFRALAGRRQPVKGWAATLLL